MTCATATADIALTQPTLARSVAAPAVHQTTWVLEPGKAMQLRAWSDTVLQIRQGRAWITRDATRHQGSEDLVLGSGEVLRLARGERLVMEPWDGAGVTYLWTSP